jgi:O6-methylguanine-DNA--protein-cysteine methyltransferase
MSVTSTKHSNQRELSLEDAKWLEAFIERAKWKFAWTQARIYPHEYTTKKYCTPEDHSRMIDLIKRYGVREPFHKTNHKYLHFQERKYWHMGDPYSSNPDHHPNVINRVWLNVHHHAANVSHVWTAEEVELQKRIWEIQLEKATGQVKLPASSSAKKRKPSTQTKASANTRTENRNPATQEKILVVPSCEKDQTEATLESWPEFGQMPDSLIRDAYGHASQFQRRWWEHLAKHPGKRFSFAELAEAVDTNLSSIRGSMGRFAARSKDHYSGQRPYRIYIDQNGKRSRIWMDSRAAQIIQQEAALVAQA